MQFLLLVGWVAACCLAAAGVRGDVAPSCSQSKGCHGTVCGSCDKSIHGWLPTSGRTCYRCDPPLQSGHGICNNQSHTNHYCADSPGYVKPSPPPPSPPTTAASGVRGDYAPTSCSQSWGCHGSICGSCDRSIHSQVEGSGSTCYRCNPPVNDGHPTCIHPAPYVQHYCADSPQYVKPTLPPPPPPATAASGDYAPSSCNRNMGCTGSVCGSCDKNKFYTHGSGSTCYKCVPSFQNGNQFCNSQSHTNHYCADPPPSTLPPPPSTSTTATTTTASPPPSCALHGDEIQITIPSQDLDARTGGTSTCETPDRAPKLAFDGFLEYTDFHVWEGHCANTLAGDAHTKSQHNYLTVDLGKTMVLTKLKFFPEPGYRGRSPTSKHYERMPEAVTVSVGTSLTGGWVEATPSLKTLGDPATQLRGRTDNWCNEKGNGPKLTPEVVFPEPICGRYFKFYFPEALCGPDPKHDYCCAGGHSVSLAELQMFGSEFVEIEETVPTIIITTATTISDAEKETTVSPAPTTSTTTTTTTTTTSTTAPTTTTTTTTTATVYDSKNVDCVETQDECSDACESGAQRNYRLLVASAKNGKKCNGPTDCSPGDGQCPDTTAATAATTTTVGGGKAEGSANTNTNDDVKTDDKNGVQPTATPLGSSTTLAADASLTPDGGSTSSSIAAPVVGGVAGLLVVAVCCALFVKRRRMRQELEHARGAAAATTSNPVYRGAALGGTSAGSGNELDAAAGSFTSSRYAEVDKTLRGFGLKAGADGANYVEPDPNQPAVYYANKAAAEGGAAVYAEAEPTRPGVDYANSSAAVNAAMYAEADPNQPAVYYANKVAAAAAGDAAMYAEADPNQPAVYYANKDLKARQKKGRGTQHAAPGSANTCARGEESGGRACSRLALPDKRFCRNHSCGVLGCTKSKSSADKVCAAHKDDGGGSVAGVRRNGGARQQSVYNGFETKEEDLEV